MPALEALLTPLLAPLSGPIAAAFAVMMGLSAVLYAAAHLAPRALVRFNSVPWAFQLQKACDLRYQAVLYGAFHTHAWARVSHYSLAWDQPLWLALLWLLHPAAALTALGLLLLQAALLRAPKLGAVLAVTWLAVAALGWGLTLALGAAAAPLCMALLLFGGLLRFTGHLFEPLPPGMVKEGDFVPMREAGLRPNILVSPLIGVISEFAAGFPFRLFLVQVLWLSERVGLSAPAHGSLSEHLDDARAVHDGGWQASPVTAWMLSAEA